eukprot:scaffold8306_cov66-Skeletonema_marinoi.AAC.1
MSRKARDFGPFKTRNDAPITDALVILTSTLKVQAKNKGNKKNNTKDSTVGSDYAADDGVRRHPMHEYAGCAQSMLLGEHIDCSYDEKEEEKKHGGCEVWHHDKQFQRIIIVDVATMVEAKEGDDGADNSAMAFALNNMIQKEMETSEPVKGFGKQLLRLLQRLNLQNATLAAE